MPLPLISIIVPVYNVAPYVRKCLESVAVQTYKGRIECLIVDDCGQDNSVAIAQQFVDEYKGDVEFRIFHHEHNRGLSAARNTGIKESKGDYVYFLDSDDWIVPECLELMVDCLDKYPESDVVQSGAKVMGSGYEWMDFEGKKLPDYSDNPVWIKKAFMSRYYLNMTAWGKLIKKEFLQANDISFAEGYVHEDEILNVDLAMNVKRIAVCHRNTYVYELRENSIMGSKRSVDDDIMRKLKCWNHIADKLVNRNDNVLVRGVFGWANESAGRIPEMSSGVAGLYRQFMIRLSKEATGIVFVLMTLWVRLPYVIRRRWPINRWVHSGFSIKM